MTTPSSPNNTELLAPDVKKQTNKKAPAQRRAMGKGNPDNVLNPSPDPLPFSASGQLRSGFAGQFGVLLLLGGRRFPLFLFLGLGGGWVPLVCV